MGICGIYPIDCAVVPEFGSDVVSQEEVFAFLCKLEIKLATSC